jgi:hypothetical protein
MTSPTSTVTPARGTSEWHHLDSTPILFANQFLVQHQPDEFFMTIGQAPGLSPVPVYTIARVGLTRHRLVELIAVLEEKLAEHDRQTGHG